MTDTQRVGNSKESKTSAEKHDNSTRYRTNALRVIVTSLFIDILAFTVILPLLPRLLDHYDTHGDRVFHSVKQVIQQYRSYLGLSILKGSRLDIVLVGGLVGSLFSLLQFVAAPVLGSLSDTFGRRRVLLLSMIGNAISMLLWMFAASFPVFLLSRVVGGLTEGNVQMSIAMISDVTEPKTRSRSLAWVGIAFAAGFSIGPPLGAYLAGFDMRLLLPKWPVNAFSAPALFAFILIIVETVYMVLYLPETRPQSTPPVAQSQSDKRTANIASIESKNVLARLGLVHFIFLFVFSGMEFTLVFLTFDRFGFSNMQQGYLLAFVGVFSALIQGGYVRRMAHKVGERRLVIQGIASCSIGLFIIGVSERTELLYLGAVFLSFTSGTVVTSLTALASMSQAKVGMGRALGSFRSAGQLGRALGPVSACTAYWVFGSTRAYLSASLALLVLVICTHILIPKQQKQDAKQD